MSRGRTRGSTSHTPEAAHEAALRLLERRALSEIELRRALSVRGFAGEAIERAVARLRAAGLVDDRALARERIAAGATRGGRAPDRLRRELVARGVAEEEARAAWDETAAEEGLDPDRLFERDLARELARAGERPEGRALRRVYNALLRAGWEPERVSAALEPLSRNEDTTPP